MSTCNKKGGNSLMRARNPYEWRYITLSIECLKAVQASVRIRRHECQSTASDATIYIVNLNAAVEATCNDCLDIVEGKVAE